MTIAAYIRVSSKAQDHASQRDAIERRGAKVDRWYAEKASAKTTQRAALQQVIADARAGLIAELWVFRLDRLTRSGVADTFRVVGELRDAGVTLHSVSDNITIKPGSDVTSDVMLFALGLAAQIERTAINERISAARVRMEARGEAWGRPSSVCADKRAQAVSMRSGGQSVRAIAKALGMTKSTVARLTA
jgi:DNA invertase Pin-like site-specific DNA recombinase